MVRLIVGPRLAAVLVILAGLLMSLDAAEPQARPRQPRAGYIVVAADLHVHSFPGDGVLPPWDLAVEARRRHLDAIVLTNHNSTRSWRLAQWLSMTNRAGGALLIPGDELTSVGFHFAMAGVTMPVAWHQSAVAAAAAAHAAGGVVIVAHPGRESWESLDDAALAAVDGVEAVHPAMHLSEKSRRTLAEFYDRAVRVHPGIAAIGSTDYHRFAPLGQGRTYLLVRTATEAGILDAIRAGRTIACDGRGDAYGPPELVALLGEDCRRDQTSPPDGETTLARAGAWLVWLGAVALVILGAD